MTRSVGWIVTVIAIGVGTAQAQIVLPQMRATSDIDAPYVDLPPDEALPPPRIYGPRYGGPSYGGPAYDEPRYAPTILPPTEVYGILRRTGYSPLGIPQQRGFVYTISVISPDGDDGRLVIDARTGRILRFMPAYRMGDRMSDQVTVAYGPPAPLPPITDLRGPPRPPAPLPRTASRTPAVPLPKPMPRAVATPKAAAIVAAPAKPADAQASVAAPVPAAPPTVIEVKPSPTVQPTQDMPAAQGLE